MANPGLTKTFIASGAVPGRRIVKMASDTAVDLATAGTQLSIGVSEGPDAANTDVLGVILEGTAEVVAGGTIARGASVTATTGGAALTATTGQVAIGFALRAAVSGDIVDIKINRHTAA